MMPFYWWFKPEQTAEILANLQSAGQGARLEIHPCGEWGLKVRVKRDAIDNGTTGAPAFDDGGGTNHSVICPPICP